MSWETMKKAKEEGGSSMFVKLADGQSIEGVFRGDPYCYYAKFKDPKEFTHWEEGLSFKFKINFVAIENGKLVPKIFQGGAKVRDALLDAKEEYGIDTIFKIKRTGSGKDDTRYAVLFKAKLTPEQTEKIKALPLKELVGKVSATEEMPEDDTPPPSEDGIPF